MELQLLEVRTGCRIHFGLMELAEGAPHRFGGLGLMLSHPGFVLRFSRADTLTIDGAADNLAELTRRIESVATLRGSRKTVEVVNRSPPCRITVTEALPLHSGLGAGTQLACAVAVGLELWEQELLGQETLRQDPLRQDPLRQDPLRQGGDSLVVNAAQHTSPARAQDSAVWQPLHVLAPTLTKRWLVQNAGRGLRSAVGLAGFQQGGLLLDEGYVTGSTSILAERPLKAHVTPLPAAWRVVLLSPTRSQRVHGSQESALISELGSVQNSHASRMLHLAHIIHSLSQSDDRFLTFTSTLDEYMELGAHLFSRYQHGLYNGPAITAAVGLARSVGLRGVGQSSWGPTVFGFAQCEEHSQQMAKQLRAVQPEWSVTVTTPAATGAEVRRVP